jgi:MFS transporter, ACS family, pantothenate transporter
MAVGQLPNGFIIQKVAPRIWFPSMVVVWAGLTVSFPYTPTRKIR